MDHNASAETATCLKTLPSSNLILDTTPSLLPEKTVSPHRQMERRGVDDAATDQRTTGSTATSLRLASVEILLLQGETAKMLPFHVAASNTSGGRNPV
jgi:hypothetical protein